MLPEKVKFSSDSDSVLNQPFEITQIFLHSVRQTWGIENRTDLQRHFRFLLRIRLERDHARHETVGHGAPRNSAAGNLQDDVEEPCLATALRMPCVREMRVIDSSHFS